MPRESKDTDPPESGNNAKDEVDFESAFGELEALVEAYGEGRPDAGAIVEGF